MVTDVLEHKVWAVCGDVLNEEKIAYRIVRCLKFNRYTVYPMMNKEKEGVYTEFTSMPEKPQVLVLCTRSEYGIEIVKKAKDAGVHIIWATAGDRSSRIRDYCRENNMRYIEGSILAHIACN